MYIEPNSEIKQMAATCRQFYNAFKEVGFSDEQSYDLACKMIIAGMNMQSK